MILNVDNSTSLREWHFTARCSIFRIPAVTTAFRQLVLIPEPVGCTIILETGGLGKVIKDSVSGREPTYSSPRDRNQSSSAPKV